MSESSVLTYGQGKMLSYDAAVVLEALVADLRQGMVTVLGESGPVRVELPAQAKLEIEFKGKVKPGKSKHKLAIEITWKEKDEAEEDAPCQGEPPCQSDA
jgi:amphi-Trp domain-containing protein